MITQCPTCGCETYTYTDHGNAFVYCGTFGNMRTEEELSETINTRPAPVYCKCDDCGRRFKLSEVREESK